MFLDENVGCFKTWRNHAGKFSYESLFKELAALQEAVGLI
jgi:hypothetical protein